MPAQPYKISSPRGLALVTGHHLGIASSHGVLPAALEPMVRPTRVIRGPPVTVTTPPNGSPSARPPDLLPQVARVGRDARTDELIELLRLCTDEDERDRLQQELVMTNMPVARAIASRYRHRGIPSEDLEQVAYLGLARAAQRFDPAAGHAFLSFCVPTVTGEVRRHFRDNGWMVRPPRRLQELQQRVTRAQSELTFQLGRSPAAREIAEHLEVEIDQVLEAIDGRGAFTPASLDLVVGDGEATLGDLLGSGSSDSSGSSESLSVEARVMLGPAVRRLGERDRLILQRRFFDGRPQREIADELGVTQMQVSRLLTRIFRELREALGPLEHPDSPGYS
jgi:RNA polymerase sigma-B factor